jgi:hypothetical protein
MKVSIPDMSPAMDSLVGSSARAATTQAVYAADLERLVDRGTGKRYSR